MLAFLLAASLLTLTIETSSHRLHPDDPHKINHDAVVSLEQNATAQQLLLEPAIKLGKRTCNPYPAVDEYGNWSGGLAPTGIKKDGGCTEADGQMYVRQGSTNNHDVLMYSFFTPKQQGQHKTHRYDWQYLVMFVPKQTAGQPDNVIPHLWKICYWQEMEDDPNKWLCEAEPKLVHINKVAHIGIRYHHGSGDTASRIDPHGDKSSDEDPTIVLLDLIAWDRMPEAARKTLNDDPFQATSPVPFNDRNFQRNVDEAYRTGLVTLRG